MRERKGEPLLPMAIKIFSKDLPVSFLRLFVCYDSYVSFPFVRRHFVSPSENIVSLSCNRFLDR